MNGSDGQGELFQGFEASRQRRPSLLQVALGLHQLAEGVAPIVADDDGQLDGTAIDRRDDEVSRKQLAKLDGDAELLESQHVGRVRAKRFGSRHHQASQLQSREGRERETLIANLGPDEVRERVLDLAPDPWMVEIAEHPQSPDNHEDQRRDKGEEQREPDALAPRCRTPSFCRRLSAVLTRLCHPLRTPTLT